MKQIITIQHTQSIHHTNGMVGSWTDWDLSELGIEQAERIGQKLAKQLSGHKIVMYLRYHFYICEKPELLGMTNHLLFMGEKK